MKQNKGIVRNVWGVPLTIVAAIPTAQSDWVRYGLPAVVLTAIFFFAIRFEADNAATPPVQPPIAATKRPPSRATSFSSLERTGPGMPSGNLDQGRSLTERSIAPRVPQPYNQPAAAALSEPQAEGRRALCGAVQFALTRVKRKHWKTKAMENAIASYRGKGGSGAAEGAVNSALMDYGRGKWDEAQCPPTVGVPPLAKGTIGAVMR